MRSAITSIIIGIIVGLMLGIPRCGNLDGNFHRSDLKFVVHDTIRTTDTVYVPKLVPYIVSKEVKVPVPYYTEVDSSQVQVIVKKKYSDTTLVDTALWVTYDAHVRGDLDKLTLGVIDKRPTMVIHDSVLVTTKETYVKYPGSLYATASSLPSLGLAYTKNRLLVQGQYHLPTFPNTPKFSIGIGYRIR